MLLYLTLFIPIFSVGQHYYGNNGTCQLIFLNDSTYCISAFSLIDEAYYDTGRYQKIDDTLFLTSNQPPCLTISTSRDTNNIPIQRGELFLIKGYRLINGEWRLQYEYITDKRYESGIAITLFCPYTLYEGDIVVVYNNWIYKRTIFQDEYFRSKSGSSGFFITVEPGKDDRVFFDRFPLLKDHDVFVPISTKKNYECWIYNGFFMPILTRQRNKTNTKCLIYRGSMDL